MTNCDFEINTHAATFEARWSAVRDCEHDALAPDAVRVCEDGTLACLLACFLASLLAYFLSFSLASLLACLFSGQIRRKEKSSLQKVR